MTLDVAINKTHRKLDVKVTIQVLKQNKHVNDHLMEISFYDNMQY